MKEEQNKYTNEDIDNFDIDKQNENDFNIIEQIDNFDIIEHEQQQLRMIFEHSNILIDLM